MDIPTSMLAQQASPTTKGGLNDYVSAYQNGVDPNAKMMAWQGARSYLNSSMQTLRQQYDVARKTGDQSKMVEAHDAIKSIFSQYGQNFGHMHKISRGNPSAAPAQPTQPQTNVAQPAQSVQPAQPVQPKPVIPARQGLTLPSHVRTV